MRVFQSLLLSTLLVMPSAVLAQDRLCAAFEKQMQQPGSLTRFALVEHPIDQQNGAFGIDGADVDGDGIEDKFELFRSGSASLIRPDNDTLTLSLTSNRKRYTIEFQRFFVMRFESKYFVVGSSWISENGPIQTSIHRVGAKGIHQVCSYNCKSISSCRASAVKAQN